MDGGYGYKWGERGVQRTKRIKEESTMHAPCASLCTSLKHYSPFSGNLLQFFDIDSLLVHTKHGVPDLLVQGSEVRVPSYRQHEWELVSGGLRRLLWEREIEREITRTSHSLIPYICIYNDYCIYT